MYRTEVETRRGPRSAAVTAVSFYFDPICPWTWITSRWLREVQRQTELDVQWKFFSLALANGRMQETLLIPLRVLALVREQEGNEAVERLYSALGTLLHERGFDAMRPRSMEDAVRRALEDAEFSPDLLEEALGDPSTLAAVTADYEEASGRFGAFGSPWLVAEGQSIGFTGPVLSGPRSGEAALELWDHVSWLITQDDFYEIKREHE